MLWQVTKASAERDGLPTGGKDSVRRVAVLTHMGRPAAVEAATRLVEGLNAAGIVSALPANDLAALDPRLAPAMTPLSKPVTLEDGIELMVVLGGDGTILRGAEWVVASEIPLLGVNLGHVGFLAEAESSEIDTIVSRVVDRSYTVEERFTIDVTLRDCKTYNRSGRRTRSTKSRSRRPRGSGCSRCWWRWMAGRCLDGPVMACWSRLPPAPPRTPSRPVDR